MWLFISIIMRTLKTWTKAWALSKHYNIWQSDFAHFRTLYPILVCKGHEWGDTVDSHLSHQRTSVTEALSVLLATSGLRILGPKDGRWHLQMSHLMSVYVRALFPFLSSFFSMHKKTWHTNKPPNRTQLSCVSLWNFHNCDKICCSIIFLSDKTCEY